MNLWKLLRLAGRIPRRPYANPYFDPGRAHHLPDGFRNLHPLRPPGAAELMRLRREAREWDSRPTGADLSTAQPDIPYLHGNRRQTSVTWIGHATVLLQVGGLNVLTDPVFSARASPLPFAGPRRHQAPGVALGDLPHIDLVLISHGHYDHLDLRSVRALARQPGGPPRFAVPLGMERWFRRRLSPHLDVRALDWWESDAAAGTRLTLVPVHHWNARTPWDRNRDLWGAWVLERDGFRFFFSGDVAWSEDIVEVGRRCGPFDLAAISIGHYEPRWFMRHNHVNPDEAVRIHREIRSRLSLGIHWGTFERLTAEPLDQPVRDLAAALGAHGISPERFFVLRHGETRRL